MGGYCRYTDPDAGFTIAHPYWDFCKSQAKDERIKRGLPIPYNWDAFFEEQFCKATPQACMDVPDAPIETSPNWTQLAVNFTTAMVRWISAGMPVVSWAEMKRRYAICSGDDSNPRCPQFSHFAGTFITKCSKCGCASVKLALQTEKCPIGRW